VPFVSGNQSGPGETQSRFPEKLKMLGPKGPNDGFITDFPLGPPSAGTLRPAGAWARETRSRLDSYPWHQRVTDAPDAPTARALEATFMPSARKTIARPHARSSSCANPSALWKSLSVNRKHPW